jgi:thiosulfate/3-mercaptopyruvate sulfurtransferase
VRYRFIDCRYDLMEPPNGRAAYRAGHIPGAAFADLDGDLSDLTHAPAAGRHPLPTAAGFAASAGRLGIDADTFAVAYDDGVNGGAARLWWLLRHFGHDAVAVLAGGIDAWIGPLETGDAEVEPAAFTPRERDDDTITADELHARLGDRRLAIVDARGAERFAGAPSDDPRAKLDPVAGHIPGAVNMPYADDATPSPELLAADEIVVYCGSGVTACVPLLAIYAAGRTDVRLYPGSWSEWSRRGLPAETGPG